MDVIEEETTEDMNLLGGVGSEERLDSTLTESFKNRIPWLIVNLFTAIMASSVVSVFEGTIAKVVALATISPIITGMGGNAGTQTLTIVVRGLSLGELDKENARKVLLKEIGLGILNGVIIGALVSLGAWFFAGNPWFGVVAGLAMICNMVIATLAGYFVPVILDQFTCRSCTCKWCVCNNIYRYVWFFCVFRIGNNFNDTFNLEVTERLSFLV